MGIATLIAFAPQYSELLAQFQSQITAALATETPTFADGTVVRVSTGDYNMPGSLSQLIATIALSAAFAAISAVSLKHALTLLGVGCCVGVAVLSTSSFLCINPIYSGELPPERASLTPFRLGWQLIQGIAIWLAYSQRGDAVT